MTWSGDYLLAANGKRLGAAFPSGNLYTSVVYFRGVLYMGKTATLALAKEQLEEWWRGVQEVKL